jgi:hypothetical protein
VQKVKKEREQDEDKKSFIAIERLSTDCLKFLFYIVFSAFFSNRARIDFALKAEKSNICVYPGANKLFPIFLFMGK